MKMPLPTISSEGGPILIGDYERILKWRGIENGGADYSLACSRVAESNLNNIDDSLLVWDFGGPGTGEIIFQHGSVIFLRTWANKEIDDEDVLGLASKITFQATNTQLVVSSGMVIFLWAPEDASTITSVSGDAGIPTGDFSMGGTAHFQRIRNGRFQTHTSHGSRNEIEYTALKIDRMP